MADNVNYGDFIKALDAARKVAPNNAEYWLGRDLQRVLNYARWESFEELIQRASTACDTSGVPPEHHFRPTTKMVGLGSGAERKVKDWFLSRYACYLIAMNGESRMAEIAYAQQYFAVQTRLQEQAAAQIEKYDRIEHRRRVSAGVKALNSAAKKAGVQRYGLFHDAGYRGLYGGLGLSAIKERKQLPLKEDLLDRAGRTELAAIEFKNSQTEGELIRVQGEQPAIDTHHRVGVEVRQAMKRIGGTMPEDLAPEESVKKLAPAPKKGLLAPPKN